MQWRIILSVSFISLFCSCGNSTDQEDEAAKAFKRTLTEQQIGNSSFYISVPAGYTIKETEGPDFSVYYFSHSDTTRKAGLSGGLYFGNFPSEFEAPNDSCKVEKMRGVILQRFQGWTVHDCNGAYSIQAIIKNRNSQGWDNQIHVFGHGASKDEVNKILQIYSTLTYKK